MLYYKARCVTRYDAVVAGSRTEHDLVEGFAAKLAETIREEAPMHRLWYDLRSQSMFDPSLQDAVRAIDLALEGMIWRVVTRYAELAGRPPALQSATSYAMLDGLFQQALLACGHDPSALEGLVTQVRAVMPLLLAPVAGTASGQQSAAGSGSSRGKRRRAAVP